MRPGGQGRGPTGDGGSATVLVLTVAGLAITALTALAWLGAVELARQHADQAADLSALAAAAQLGGPACGRAVRVAVANGAQLTGCRPEGSGVWWVSVQVPVPAPVGRPARSQARAGPGPAP